MTQDSATRDDEARQAYHEGRDLLETGRAEAAAAELRRSLELCPHSSTARLLADALMAIGAGADALAAAGLAYALNPRMDISATRFADLLLGYGDEQRAAEIVTEVLARNPDYGPAREILSKIEEPTP